ncbi:MAG: hydroxymethylglutaryl-CoA lyase [Vampirovibrionales bacterium]
MKSYPKQVHIVEVGPRDGLQNEPSLVSTTDKIHFIQALEQAGLHQIEIAAFVSPKAVPQMANSLEVVCGLNHPFKASYSALVPNLKGLDRAIESGIKRIAVFTATSNQFTQKNIGMSVDESIATFKPVIQHALENKISVRGYISTVWVCPYEGLQTKDAANRIVHELFAMGVDEISLGDTIGAATPPMIQETLDSLLSFDANWLPKLALHCHDTYGTALANVMAGLEMGVTTFDTSAGGLGGCPYAPGASGNLATEDLVSLLDRMGINSGVDLNRLINAIHLIETTLNRPLQSKTYQRLKASNLSCI